MSKNPFGEVISVYTRQQAIEDGVLVPCPPAILREAGFVIPLCFTHTVFAIIEQPCDDGIHSLDGVIWDVLWMLHLAAKKFGDKQIIPFEVFIHNTKKRRDILHKFICHIGPGDTAAPVLTVMFPSED